MISEIKLKNFRSIKSETIRLSPLTVIIGANGSGKSNLVKALEFISNIPACGLGLSVNRQGGRDGMIPKSVPLRELGKHEVSIGYTMKLPAPPINKSTRIENVSIHHAFGFSFKSSSRVSVNFETLKFDDFLYIGEFFRNSVRGKPSRGESKSASFNYEPSSFSISNNGKEDSYGISPPLTSENIERVLSWLGISRFRSTLKEPSDLHDYLKFSQNNLSKKTYSSFSSGPRIDRRLYIDRESRTIVDDAHEYRMFLDFVQQIRRYDLLLNELRKEQSPSDVPDMSKYGGNLPAALKHISLDKKAYARLISTFETIAPHILKIKSKQLKTGKEFIEFSESKLGRGIESWETSDGSLRALAILIAVENGQPGETIIIEEPEQNLHPWAIRALLDHIREVIDEKSVQVVLTTHSEHVLDRVSAGEVLVASRTQADGTKFKRIDEIVKKGPIDMGEIGRLWVKGMLGGVPSIDF